LGGKVEVKTKEIGRTIGLTWQESESGRNSAILERSHKGEPKISVRSGGKPRFLGGKGFKCCELRDWGTNSKKD